LLAAFSIFYFASTFCVVKFMEIKFENELGVVRFLGSGDTTGALSAFRA
jgi:hypothetical protein